MAVPYKITRGCTECDNDNGAYESYRLGLAMSDPAESIVNPDTQPDRQERGVIM